MNQILDKSDYITDKSQLADYFFQSCKKKEDFKVGIEFERIGVDLNNCKAISYSGESGTAEFLNRIKNHGFYDEISENNNVIGLKGHGGDITLEPGCQLEFSTKPFLSLKEHENIITEFRKHARSLAQEMGIAWLGYGLQPLSTYENIEMIPKQRYKIMSEYLPTKGNMALVMMKESAGVQTSIDYGSEEDAMKKLRVALGISPILTAMFSNSPIRAGKDTGYKSYRAAGWLETDNDRCGLISKKIFDEDFGFTDYVDVVLDVPMFFIERDNTLINMTHTTFRQYMNTQKATMDDWMLHMSTFFPEVRLKNLLEVRNCDCQRTDLTLAFPALIKGILYNEDALNMAWTLVKDMSWEERNELRNSVPKNGLRGVEHIAKELVAIARTALAEEAIYLEPIEELLSNSQTPADVIIKNWHAGWNKDLKKLIEHTSL